MPWSGQVCPWFMETPWVHQGITGGHGPESWGPWGAEMKFSCPQPRAGPSRAKGGTTLADNSLIKVGLSH